MWVTPEKLIWAQLESLLRLLNFGQILLSISTSRNRNSDRIFFNGSFYVLGTSFLSKRVFIISYHDCIERRHTI